MLAAGRGAGLGCGSTATSSARARACGSPSRWAPPRVDHCTYLTDADVDALAGGETVATLLPGAEFSTRQPYPDARRLLDAGVTVALATDCNPGSSYTTSMAFCIALAVREMGMTPDEALRAATLGRRAGAAAHRHRPARAGGPRRRSSILDAPSYVHLAYRPGVPLVATTIAAGDDETYALTNTKWTVAHSPAALDALLARTPTGSRWASSPS